MPRLEQWEIKKYWQIFCGLKPADNKLSKEKLGPVFHNSHLDDDTLTQIWDLADIDEDSQLDFEEFCIAMRLIFDMVNGNITHPPSNLPSWLIPGSKKALLKSKQPLKRSGSTSSDDEDYNLSEDFDWYMAPTDKAAYEKVYNSSCDGMGKISFKSLRGLYKTLGDVPETDISSAWNLVNPKQEKRIDKDQCLVFLHMLNQRSHGKRMPHSVPASLRATFSKETPSYDINSHQGDVKVNGSSNSGFGSQYLHESTGDDNDLSGSHEKEWEEVRLKRELQEVTDKLEKAQREQNASSKSTSQQARSEYQQLLKYKQAQAAKVGNSADLKSAEENIEEVENEVHQLETFLQSQKEELAKVSN